MVDQIVGELSFEPRGKNFCNEEKMSKKKENNIEKEIVRAILRSAYIRECAERVVSSYESGLLIGKPKSKKLADLTISCLRNALKGYIPDSLPEEFIDEFKS